MLNKFDFCRSTVDYCCSKALKNLHFSFGATTDTQIGNT